MSGPSERDGPQTPPPADEYLEFSRLIYWYMDDLLARREFRACDVEWAEGQADGTFKLKMTDGTERPADAWTVFSKLNMREFFEIDGEKTCPICYEEAIVLKGYCPHPFACATCIGVMIFKMTRTKCTCNAPLRTLKAPRNNERAD